MEQDGCYQRVCTLSLSPPLGSPQATLSPMCLQPWKQASLPCSGHRQNAQPAPPGHSVLRVGGAVLLLW